MHVSDYLKGKKGRVTNLSNNFGLPKHRLYAIARGTAKVPIGLCPVLEIVSRGQVTVEEMRPDIDWNKFLMWAVYRLSKEIDDPHAAMRLLNHDTDDEFPLA